MASSWFYLNQPQMISFISESGHQHKQKNWLAIQPSIGVDPTTVLYNEVLPQNNLKINSP